MLDEINVLILRTIKQILANKMSFLIGIVFTLGIVLLLGYGIDSFVKIKGLNVSFTEFMGPGYFALMIVWGGFGLGFDLIQDRKGFLKILLVSPISKYSILFGTILGGLIGYLLMFPLTILIFLIFIKSLSLTKLVLSIFFITLLTLGFSGFGLWFSSFFKNIKNYQLMMGIMYWALLLLSGVFYPIKNLPVILKILVQLNPVTYGSDGFRWILIGITEFGIITDILVLSIFGFVSIVLGTYLFDKNLRK